MAGLGALEDREPDEPGRIGDAFGSSERLVHERDQPRALGVVGEDVLDAVAGRAQPVAVEVAVAVEQPERFREVAERAEVGPGEAHPTTFRSKV